MGRASPPRCLVLNTIAPILLAVTTPVAGRGATYLVRPDGSGDFPDIQTAVEEAADGDIIELADGVFTGEGNRDIWNIGKSLSFRSVSGDPTTCVIECQGAPGQRHRGFAIDLGVEGEVSLAGVTVRTGFNGVGGAVTCLGGSVTIAHCVFADSEASLAGGILFADGLFHVVECVFTGNVAESGGAVFCGSGTAVFEGCTFSRNEGTGSGGAARLTDGDFEFRSCTFYANRSPAGSCLYAIGDNGLSANCTADRCIMAEGEGSPAIICEGSAAADFSCTDLFGFEGGELGRMRGRPGGF